MITRGLRYTLSLFLIILLIHCTRESETSIPTLPNSETPTHFPDSGSLLKMGETYVVRWDRNNFHCSEVDLSLRHHSYYREEIANQVENTGQYAWKIQNWVDTGIAVRMVIHCSDRISDTLLGPPFTIVGLDEDEFEPDSTPAQASRLLPGDTSSSHTLKAYEDDWFTFSAQKDTSYAISFISQGYANGQLSIISLDSLSLLLSTSNHSSVWNCPQSGNYFIKVTNNYSSQSYYRILVQKTVRPTVRILKPESSSVISLGQYDSLVFFVAGNFGFAYNLELFQGGRLMRSLSNYARHDSSDTIRQTFHISDVPTGKGYQLRVSSLLDPECHDFSDSFAIVNILQDTCEPDNSPAMARLVSLPQQGNHQRTLHQGDEDWIVFYALSNVTYSISTSSSLDTYLELFGPDTTTKLRSADDYGPDLDALMRWTCKTSGFYFLRICGFSAVSDGSYRLYIYEGSASTILVTAPDSTAIWNSTFPLMVRINNYGSYISYYNIDLFRSDSFISRLLANGNMNYSNTLLCTLKTPQPWDDAYQILVSDAANPECFDFSDTFEIASTSQSDSFEIDDSPAQAKHINFGTDGQYHFLGVNDTDWITFNAVQGYTYSISLSCRTYAAFFLFDSSTLTTVVRDSTHSDYYYRENWEYTLKRNWISPASGTYYCRISNLLSYESGQYFIAIRETP